MVNQEIMHKSVFRQIRLGAHIKQTLSLAIWCSIVTISLMLPRSTAAWVANVSLSAAPANLTINAGEFAAYTININRDNYTDKVTLNASNLPAGATASFSPNPTAGKNSILIVTTKAAAPAGAYKIKIGGSAIGISIAPITINMIVKAAPSIALSTLPARLSIIAGQATTAEVLVARTNYDGPVYLAAENAPQGVTVAFAENPVRGIKSTMLIYSHGLPHLWGELGFTVSATYNGIVSKYPVRMIVNCGMVWVEQFGSAQHDINVSGTGDTYQSIAVDSSGNSYVAGDSYGQTSDVWAAKYNSSGQQLWFITIPISTDREDRVLDIAIDNLGNLFLGGYTDTRASLNDSPNFDFWIAKYDDSNTQPGGQPLQKWIKRDGGLVEDGANGFEIAPDNTGGGTLTTFMNDRSDVVTYSFGGANGFLTFQNGISIPGDRPWDLALGPNNTVVLVGETVGHTAWIRQYDNQNDSLLFDRTFLVQDSSGARRVIVDGAGKIYVAGTSIEINGFDLGVNAWVRIYDQSGGYVQQLFMSPGNPLGGDDSINALALDNNGDLIVAGKTTGMLGEGSGDPPGEEDPWIARLHGVTADLIWIRQFPVTGNDSFEAVVIGGNGGIVLAGYTTAFKGSTGSQDALLMWYKASITPPPSPSLFFPPFISGFSNPATGQNLTGAAVGETVQLRGGNFGFFGPPPVRFNGTLATATLISPRSINAVVPEAARGATGYVTITIDCECVRSPVQFAVFP
jgi:hypothetical protein